MEITNSFTPPKDVIELDRIVHCYPISGPEHDCSIHANDDGFGGGSTCWCNPEHELIQGWDGRFGLLLIHRLLH